MDLRIEEIFYEEMKGDTSFSEKPHFLSVLFGGYNPKHKAELKETWNRGIKLGIEIGLRRNSFEGQKIELNNNTNNPKHKEFIRQFYKLCTDFKCAIQYHPIDGMCIIDRSNEWDLK